MIFALFIAVACAMTAQEQRECIIAEARAQFGKPYVLATEGPDTFDCSGLVQWCYEHCGYYFDFRPHTWEIIEMGISVEQNELILADIVFPSSGHVQLYSGNGNIIHAPHSGEVVKEQAMYNWYAGRRLIIGDSDAAYINSKVQTLTALNIRSQASPSSEAVDVAEEGEKLPFDSYVFAEERHWLSYIGDSGNRRYYCSKNNQGECYTDPCAIKGTGSTTITTTLTVRDATSTSAPSMGYAHEGDVINYDVVFKSDGRTWISWLSGSDRRYAVCQSSSGTYCDPVPA